MPDDEDVRLMGLPTVTGELLPAVTPVGTGFTVTEVVAIAVHPALVTITWYVPIAANAADGMLGFWSVELNPFTPVHAKVQVERAI